jgi:protein TonB
MTVTADPSIRLVPDPDEENAQARRRRFAALLALAFLLHAALIAILLIKSSDQNGPPTQAEEIPVELVAELPPEPKVEPPPPPPPPMPPKREQPKPKIVQDEMKPAFDAPRDANQETVEREAPDKETRAQRVAPPTKQAAEKPAREAGTVQETAPDPSPQHAPEKIAEEKVEDKPDAEAIAEAAKKEPAKSKDRQAKRDPVKTPPSEGKRGSVADQLAALAPTPNYSVGSRAKAAPVAGGTENTTYLSILYGLIMRHWRDPPGSTIRALSAEGIVVFYVDERGNLTHQAVYRASGRPDLDAAAATAVRAAAPFPAPPRGMPRAIAFHYGTK